MTCAEINETPVTERQPQADAGSGEAVVVGDPLRGRDTMSADTKGAK